MEHLRVNLGKLTYREVWQWGSLSTFLLFASRRLLSPEWYSPTEVPDTPGIIRVPADDLPPNCRAPFEHALRELGGCGFGLAFYYRVPARGPSGIVAATLDSGGTTLCAVALSPHRAGRLYGVSLLTRVGEGRYLATGHSAAPIQPPPEVVACRVNGPAAEVIGEHQRRIRGEPIERLTPADIEPLILELQRLTVRYNLNRGVYVRTSAALRVV